MRCSACEAESPAGARFCMHCAAPFAPRCTGCQAELPAGARFCPQCAHPAGAGTTSPPVPDPPARTTEPPTYLTEKIRRAKPGIEGERKQVTVLFADVKGSMELAEQFDAEAWSAIMQRFFTILTEGVERFEGFVDKFTGDGIMALFGAPIAHEDHAQRACYAALHLQGELARHAIELKRQHGVGFSTRMGINSGAVVVGSIGDDLTMSYTAQGHTVGLAQRMEALASPDTCYVSAATAALVSGYLQLEDLGEFQLKGVSAPMRVHRLVGAGTATTRLDISRARGLSTFVGRDADMATLDAALAQAQAGHGQVVGVVAAAGTGKSRLCFEFAERCRARGVAVNTASAVAHGKNIPYLPMLQVFRAYFGIGDHDDDATAREKIAGRLLLLDDGFRDLLPILFEFHQVPDPDRPPPAMDPEAKQRQLFAVVRRVVQDPRAGATRVVALLEDLHWFDPASETLLAQWVDAIAGSSSLLIVNFRPEYRADWMQKSYYRQLPLAPLGSEAIRALLGDLLGPDPSTQALADLVHAHTGGNPFFTEEVLQSLIESGALQGRRGAYRLVTPVERLAVPPSVQALLSARIDRLDEREKLVLQTAAVIGKEFGEPILRQVLAATARPALADGELTDALQALTRRELVFETSLFPIAQYTFKHPLTQEVALGSQLQERRRQVHAAVAHAIEAAHPDKLDEQAALLAHHTAEAGRPLDAAGWHARAARFVGRNDFDEAFRHWKRARTLLRDAPHDPATAAFAATVCFSVLAVGGFRLEIPIEESHPVFEEGLAWAARTDDPLLAARLHQAMSVLHAGYGRLEASLEHAAEWARVTQSGADEERRAISLWPSLGPLAFRGDLATARANAEQQLAWIGDHPTWGMRDWGMSAQATALWTLAAVEALAGSCAGARALLERGLRAVRSLGDGEHDVILAVELVTLGGRVGEPEIGRVAAQRAVEVGETLGKASRFGGHLALGLQRLLDGDPEQAVTTLEHALSLEILPTGTFALRAHRALAAALLGAGEPARAIEVADDNLARSLAIGARVQAIDAAVTLAAALRAHGGVTAASRIDEALAIAERMIADTGAHNLAAFVQLECAALAALQGEIARRTTHLRAALAIFTRMGATGHARTVTTMLDDARPRA